MDLAPHTLPMFPLGTVLFPHALLPLHVFEPRYRIMTRRILAGRKEFGVVLIERGREVGGGDVRFEVGTLASVVRATELAGGRYALTTVGVRRIRVERWLPDDPYPQAEVAAAPDARTPEPERGAREQVGAALATVFRLARQLDHTVGEPPLLAADPERASYEAAALAPIGPLDAQRVLEAPSAGARLALLGSLLQGRAAELRARLGIE